MLKAKAFDNELPILTRMETVVAAAMSSASISAVTWLEPTEVVERGESFQSTTDLGPRFCPSTLKANDGCPATMVVGVRLAILGAPPGTDTSSGAIGEPPSAQPNCIATKRNRPQDAGSLKVKGFIPASYGWR